MTPRSLRDFFMHALASWSNIGSFSQHHSREAEIIVLKLQICLCLCLALAAVVFGAALTVIALRYGNPSRWNNRGHGQTVTLPAANGTHPKGGNKARISAILWPNTETIPREDARLRNKKPSPNFKKILLLILHSHFHAHEVISAYRRNFWDLAYIEPKDPENFENTGIAFDACDEWPRDFNNLDYGWRFSHSRNNGNLVTLNETFIKELGFVK